ncbi:hypothetical protein G5C65_38000, partial [Streptomyces sp. SB3404]|nr:hypothetical protein [Streptomyces boncukensis]
MNRTLLGFLGVVVALAAVTGAATVAAPGDDGAQRTASPAVARKPVERSTLVCPRPADSDVAETTYTAFTPKGASGRKGSAELRPAETADPDSTGGGKDGKDDKDGKSGKGGDQD